MLGSVDLSWSVDKATDAYLTLYGSQGTISVGWTGARYRQVGSPDFVEFGEGYDKFVVHASPDGELLRRDPG